MRFSLIVATKGRYEEVIYLLKSIRQADYSKEKIQIIIVDQNKKNSISQITELPDNFTPYLEALIKNSDKDQIQNNLAIYKDKGGKVNE